MSAEHFRTHPEYGPSGKIGNILLRGIRERGQEILGIAGVVVEEISTTIKNISSTEPVPSSAESPVSPFNFYQD